jgi:hypothetical protein
VWPVRRPPKVRGVPSEVVGGLGLQVQQVEGSKSDGEGVRLRSLEPLTRDRGQPQQTLGQPSVVLVAP